jgi:proteasome accessory factor B/proteasome accessory factor C
MRERCSCRIDYRKPEARAPEPRVVDPFVLLAAEGPRYLVGHCRINEEVRVLRADRVAVAALLEECFTVPEGFDPREYVRRGRVFLPVGDVEVPVRTPRASPAGAPGRWQRGCAVPGL